MVSTLLEKNSVAVGNYRLLLEHIHSLIDHPYIILGVGIYATISNCVLGVAILCKFEEGDRRKGRSDFDRFCDETSVETSQTTGTAKTQSPTTLTEETPLEIM